MQADSPPLYPLLSSGSDQVRGDVWALDIPPQIEAQLQRDTLVIGEVGDRKPDAFTLRPAHGQFLVIMTSGMIDFLTAVTTTISGVICVWNADGTLHKRQSASAQETFGRLDDLLRDWRRHVEPGLLQLFRRADRIAAEKIEADGRALSLYEALALGAEHFLLAHELAHVAIDSGIAAGLDANNEVSADKMALGFYLDAAKVRFGERQAIAGAGLALRILVALQNGGARFTAAYPPQQERLALWIDALRATYTTDQSFDEEAALMAGHFDMFDVLDARAAPQNLSIPGWRARSGLIAALEGVVFQGRPPSEFVRMFRYWLSKLNDDAIAKTIQALLTYYPGVPGQPGYHDHEVRNSMGIALRSCVSMLNQEERAGLGL